MAGLIGEPPSNAPAWAGWLAIVFFGVCAVIIGKRMFETEDVLRIGVEGIWYRYHSPDLMPWSAIAGVGVWKHKGQKIIVLSLLDPAQYPGRGLAGALSGANRWLVGGDVCISLNGTDRSFSETQTEIAKWRPE